MSEFKVVTYTKASYCKHCGKRIFKDCDESKWWNSYFSMDDHDHTPMAGTTTSSVALAKLQLRNILKELE